MIAAGRVGADAAAVYGSERLRIGIEALSRAYDHLVIDAGALPNAPADRIARLAPCGVLVASGQAAAQGGLPCATCSAMPGSPTSRCSPARRPRSMPRAARGVAA